MHDVIIASWARMTMSCALSCTLAKEDSPMDWMIHGRYPYINSNGAKPIEVLTLELMVNSVIGRCLGQSSWSGLTSVL
jgi:hypothetical protein